MNLKLKWYKIRKKFKIIIIIIFFKLFIFEIIKNIIAIKRHLNQIKKDQKLTKLALVLSKMQRFLNKKFDFSLCVKLILKNFIYDFLQCP